jgi:hypothetical protein
MWKRSIANTANDLQATLHDSQAFRVLVINKTGNVFSRHFRELLLKKGFEPSQENEGFGLPVVFYRDEPYYAFP